MRERDIVGSVPVVVLVLLFATACGRIGFEVAAEGESLRALEARVDRFSTTSTAFVDIPDAMFSVPPSTGTAWLVLVSATLQSSSLDETSVEARYLVDGVERGFGGSQNSAVERAGPWQHYYLLDGTSTAQLVTVQLRDATGATATVEQLRVIALPLPGGVDPLYESLDPIQQVTATSAIPFASFTLRPASPGDYLVFLLFNASAGSDAGIDNIRIDWTGPNVLTPSTLHVRVNWQSTLFVRRLTLGSDPITIELEATTSNMAQFRNARVLALRLDALPSVEHVFDETLLTADQPTPAIAASLTPSPTSCAARCVVVASMTIDDLCTLGPTERTLHFQLDAEETVIRHFVDNCSVRPTYGIVRLLAARPSTIKTGVSVTPGSQLEHRESTIVVFDVE